MMLAEARTGIGRTAPFGATEFAFAARLAVRHLAQKSLPDELDPLGKLSPLLGHAAFRPALAALAARPLELSSDDITRLSAREDGRLALLVASEPDAQVASAARLAATAALHKSIVRLGLKAERQHAQAVLGAEGFRFATQEAPTLHSSLAVLEDSPKIWRSIATAELATASSLFEDFGRQILFSFVATVAPVLVACLPAAPKTLLAEARIPDIVKLMRRRNPAWAPIIA